MSAIHELAAIGGTDEDAWVDWIEGIAPDRQDAIEDVMARTLKARAVLAATTPEEEAWLDRAIEKAERAAMSEGWGGLTAPEPAKPSYCETIAPTIARVMGD